MKNLLTLALFAGLSSAAPVTLDTRQISCQVGYQPIQVPGGYICVPKKRSIPESSAQKRDAVAEVEGGALAGLETRQGATSCPEGQVLTPSITNPAMGGLMFWYCKPVAGDAKRDIASEVEVEIAARQ